MPALLRWILSSVWSRGPERLEIHYYYYCCAAQAYTGTTDYSYYCCVLLYNMTQRTGYRLFSGQF